MQRIRANVKYMELCLVIQHRFLFWLNTSTSKTGGIKTANSSIEKQRKWMLVHRWQFVNFWSTLSCRLSCPIPLSFNSYISERQTREIRTTRNVQIRLTGQKQFFFSLAIYDNSFRKWSNKRATQKSFKVHSFSNFLFRAVGGRDLFKNSNLRP